MSADAGLSWRAAVAADVDDLVRLERAAFVAGLGHVFGDRPYPDDAIRARWDAELAEPGVVTEVVDSVSTAWRGLAVLVCGDAEVLRHLAVAPSVQGVGLGAAAVARVRARTDGPVRLWCLERNRRALALYTRLGFAPTGRRRRTPFPPEPVEIELAAPPLPSSGAR